MKTKYFYVTFITGNDSFSSFSYGSCFLEKAEFDYLLISDAQKYISENNCNNQKVIIQNWVEISKAQYEKEVGL